MQPQGLRCRWRGVFRSLVVAGAVAGFVSGPGAAQEDPAAPPPITFFPTASVAYTPNSSIGVVQVHLLEDRVLSQYGAPFLVVADSDGLFRFDVTCHFVGPGRVRFSDPNDSTDAGILGEVEIYCGLPPEEESATAQPLAFQALATSAAVSPPVTVAGRIISYRYEQQSHFFRQRTANTTDQEDTTTVETYVRSTRQKCFNRTETCQRCSTTSGCQSLCCTGNTCQSPTTTSFCETKTLTNETQLFTLLARRSSFPAIGATSSIDSSLEMSWEFLNLPQGAQITKLEAVGTGSTVNSTVQLSHPVEAHLMTLDGDGQATPVIPAEFSNACPAHSFVPSGQVLWEFPVTIPGNTAVFRMTPAPSCHYTQGADLFDTQLVSAFRTRAKAGGELMLELEPEHDSVAPTNERFPGQPDQLGESSTRLTAKLSGAQANQTFTIRIRGKEFNAFVAGHGQTFDANAEGHTQGHPSKEFWGELDGNAGTGSTPPEATCSITSDANGEGTCEVTFQSDRVAGDTRFEATVDGENVTAQATVGVKVAGLLPVNSLFQRPNELLSGGSGHPDPFNFRSGLADKLQNLQRNWESRTASYLSFNDMSLKHGGVFDRSSDWRAPHKAHREGRSVDINRVRYDIAQPGTPKDPRIEFDENNPLRQQLAIECALVGRRLLSATEDPNSLHCEF